MKEIIVINKNELVESIDKRLNLKFDKIEELIKTINTINNQKKYLSRKETAKMFSVSLVTLHKWVNKGFLHPYYVGKRVYFKYDEVVNALENN